MGLFFYIKSEIIVDYLYYMLYLKVVYYMGIKRVIGVGKKKGCFDG